MTSILQNGNQMPVEMSINRMHYIDQKMHFPHLATIKKIEFKQTLHISNFV